LKNVPNSFFYSFINADKDDCLAHLYLEHRLVIADVEDIALLEDYLQYWEKEFQGRRISYLLILHFR